MEELVIGIDGVVCTHVGGGWWLVASGLHMQYVR